MDLPTEVMSKASETAEFTDADLLAAIAPIFQHSIAQKQISNPDINLEPLLRATIRRALAEYSPGTRPFKSPGTLDRLYWRLKTLFTSQSYEDISKK